jgi:hypothetical protein
MNIEKRDKQSKGIIDVNQIVNDTIIKLTNFLEDPKKNTLKNLKDVRSLFTDLNSIDKDVGYDLFPETIERLNKIKNELPKEEHKKSQDVFKPSKEKNDLEQLNTNRELNKKDIAIESNAEKLEKSDNSTDLSELSKIIKTIDHVIEIKEKSSKSENELDISERVIDKAIESILLDTLRAVAKNAVAIGSTDESREKNIDEIDLNPVEDDKEITLLNYDLNKTEKDLQEDTYNPERTNKEREDIDSANQLLGKNNEEVNTNINSVDKNINNLERLRPGQEKLIEYITIAAKEEAKLDENNIDIIRNAVEDYFRAQNSVITQSDNKDIKSEASIQQSDFIYDKNDPENLDRANEVSEKEIRDLEDPNIITSKNNEDIAGNINDTENNTIEKGLEDVPRKNTQPQKTINEFDSSVTDDYRKRPYNPDDDITDTSGEVGDNRVSIANPDSTNKNINKFEGDIKSVNENTLDYRKYSFSSDTEEDGDFESGNIDKINITNPDYNKLVYLNGTSTASDGEIINHNTNPLTGRSSKNNKEFLGVKQEEIRDDDGVITQKEERYNNLPGFTSKKKAELDGITQDEEKDKDGKTTQEEERHDDFPGLISKKKAELDGITQKEEKDKDGKTTQEEERHDDFPGKSAVKPNSGNSGNHTVGSFLEAIAASTYTDTGVFSNFSRRKPGKRSLAFGGDLPRETGVMGALDTALGVMEDPHGRIQDFPERGDSKVSYTADLEQSTSSSSIQEALRNTISGALRALRGKKEKPSFKADGAAPESVTSGPKYFDSNNNIKKDIIEDRTVKIESHPCGSGFLKIYRKRALDFEGTVSNDSAKVLPFQFEPVYEGDGKKAEYSSISTLGRSAAAKVYTKSNERTMQLTLSYIVTGPKRNGEDDANEGNSNSSKGMKQWDEDYIYGYIIPNFRNLVKPDISDELAYRLAPPIVQIWYGGLNEFKASTSSVGKDRNNLADVPPAFLTTWYTASGEMKTYRSLWLTESVNFEYKGGIVNRDTRNKLWVDVNISLTEIAPSVTANEILHWWNPIGG